MNNNNRLLCVILLGSIETPRIRNTLKIKVVSSIAITKNGRWYTNHNKQTIVHQNILLPRTLNNSSEAIITAGGRIHMKSWIHRK